MIVGHIGGGAAKAYQIEKSVRLRSSASAYFSRTFGTPTDGKKFTFSVWVKRGLLDATVRYLLGAGSTGNGGITLDSSGTMRFYVGGSATVTNALFRDPTAHFHVVAVLDTTQASNADRTKLYVNGVQLTVSASATVTQNSSPADIGAAVAHTIGTYPTGSAYFDGLLSEMYFIDGQALTPSSFGEQNTDGVWVPKAYTGTYGNNGFYLPFKDASTTTSLGKDYVEYAPFTLCKYGRLTYERVSNTSQSTPITGWTAGTAFPVTSANNCAVVTKDRVYIPGGTFSGGASTTIYTAPIDSSGIIGAWTTSGTSPSSGSAYQLVVVKDKLWRIGGSSNATYYCTIASDGTLGTWSSGPNLPTNQSYHYATVTNGWVHSIAGYNTSTLNVVYSAKIKDDGTLDNWVQTGTVASAVYNTNGITTNSRVYLLGGTYVNTVQWAPILADGSLGSWTTATGMQYSGGGRGVVMTKDRVHCFGGHFSDGWTYGYAESAPIDASGVIGSWTTGESLPLQLAYTSFVTTSSRVYAIGGYRSQPDNSAHRTEVYYASFGGSSNDNITGNPGYTTETTNKNPWHPNSISTTAGVTYDWMTDTPTNNYATLNPILQQVGSVANFALADGNLKATCQNVVGSSFAYGTQFVSKGKWYAEVTVTTAATDSNDWGVGVAPWLTVLYRGTDGQKRTGSGYAAYGNSYTTNDVIGIAIDADNGKAYFSKNGTWQNSGDPVAGTNPAITGLSGELGVLIMQSTTTGTAGVFVTNFGQGSLSSGASYYSAAMGYFKHPPPTGFKALCTGNLPAVAITNPKKHFDIRTRTGTSATVSVSNLDFSPDLAWTKTRSNALRHILVDRVRGATKNLFSNETLAEETATDGLTSFDANGYTIGANTLGAYSSSAQNYTGYTYVDWLWKANGAGTSNTAGSITSTVSANTTAGFSIVKIVSNVAAGGTWTAGHGLPTKPKMVIYKRTNSADTWVVYNANLPTPSDHYLALNGTGAYGTSVGTFGGMTETLLGSTNSFVQNGDTLIAYCFAEIPGYSKFGSYVGNGNGTATPNTDGTYVHLGFRPRWIMGKRSTGTADDWWIYDTVRDTYNPVLLDIRPNASNGEGVASSDAIDVTAFGFKVRGTTYNTASETYIYAAFAEFPNGSNVAPSPAR